MSEIKKQEIKLPKDFERGLAFVLYNVLSKEECAEYIRITEEKGYDEALVNVGYGRQKSMKDVRNNTRCIWDSVEEADKLFQRIKPYLPQAWKDRRLVSLNERLRFLCYHPGEYFKPHQDGMYMRDNGERSFVTVQLYLNEGFKGGSTTFLSFDEKQQVEVVPKTGSVLVFEHPLLHEGSLLKKGVKYAMRTDVMYSATKGDADVMPSATNGDADVKPSATKGDADVMPSATKGDADVMPSATKGDADVMPSATKGDADVMPSATKGDADVMPLTTKGDADVKPSATKGDADVMPSATKGNADVMPSATKCDADVKPSATKGVADVKPSATKSDADVMPSATKGDDDVKPSATKGDADVKPSATKGDANVKAGEE